MRGQTKSMITLALGSAGVLSAAILPEWPSHADPPDPLIIAAGECTACVDPFRQGAEACSQAATNEGRVGDAMVRFEVRPTEGSPPFALSATLGLEGRDKRCIKSRAEALLTGDCARACVLAGQSMLDVQVGQPRPLLPPIDDILGPWIRYRASSFPLARWWKRWRLTRLLPQDVKTTPERCLWIPATVNLGESLGLWERELRAPLPAASVARIGRPERPSVAPIIAANARPRAWRVAEQVVLLEDAAPAAGRRAAPGYDEWQEYNEGSGVRLCLVDVPELFDSDPVR